MNKVNQRKEFVYKGAGFPVTLEGFPFKKVAGEEYLDFDVHKIDLAIAKIVLLKPALLAGKEIRFLRTLIRESMEIFAKNFDVAASTVKNWEDNGKISYMIDFVIRNAVANKLGMIHNVNTNFLFHRSLLESAKARPKIIGHKLRYNSLVAENSSSQA